MKYRLCPNCRGKKKEWNLCGFETIEVECTRCRGDGKIRIGLTREEKQAYKDRLAKLADEELLDLINDYCKGCGCDNALRERPCRCWDDS